MIFSEIYGCYYNAVAAILSRAVKGELTDAEMKKIIDEKAFSESFLEIIPALKEERWQLSGDKIKHIPTIPLTELQLRWLKAVSLDRRIKLFDTDVSFLDDIKPLFTPEDIEVYDKYADGDPYEDEKYIQVFRTILYAIKEHKKIKVEYTSMKGNSRRITCDPVELEYSEKDDRFRVIVSDCRFASMLNLSGIMECEIIGEARYIDKPRPQHSKEYFVAELTDKRKSLERFLLHFAHFAKETKRIGEGKYLIKVYYDKSDETELVIRLLSFGPFVRAVEPVEFVGLIKKRLIMQKSCGPR